MLETTFTNATKKVPKTFNFKADPEYAKALTLGNIDMVNISNNHIHDYGEKGLQDTMNTLKNNNITFFGEGNKTIKDIKGIKFGFLGYMGFENTDEIKSKIKNHISDLKNNNCKIVIVTFHWGGRRQL
ncbi:CapA family protein [Clostridium sp. Marseille-Q2269]|uniref:CapA family protein n=1 Tax=Clostridium sp. Marseille-Q2269 TaxID=2942205 RepID=UPI00207476CE|nr:CapA family protein [Clostridium sp. Marseille-Q2269]